MPLLPLLVVAGSGAVRTGLGVALSGGFVIVMLLSLPLGFFIARFARPGLGNSGERIGAAAFLAVAWGLSFYALYNRWFDGLPSVGGGDAGQHLGLRRLFLTEDPNAYYGFTQFYALTHWLEAAFRLGPFQSFRAVFYAVPSCLALTCVAALLRIGSGALGFVVLGLGYGATGVFVLLPLLHYHQADGFYPHLFSLVPLLTCWVLYGAAEDRRLRLSLLPFFAVYLRFTYGLNVADLLFTSSALWAIESRGLGRAGRIAGTGGAVVLLCGALLAYGQLLPLVARMPGGVVPHRTLQLAIVQLLLALGLLALPCLAARLGSPMSEPGGRFARFAGVFCALGAAVPLGFHAVLLPVLYYLYKYSLAGVVLLVIAWAVCLAELLPGLLLASRSRAARPAAGLLVAALVLGTVFLGRSIAPQWASFVERATGSPPWNRLGPLSDPLGAERIERVLGSERRVFGGLLSSSWPLTMFMNASFGLWQDWPQYESLLLLRESGRCWFWYAQPDPFGGFGANVVPPLAEKVAELERDPSAKCDEHPARWDPRLKVRLCHACR